MELAPFGETARVTLLEMLKKLREPIDLNEQENLYAIKTFPNIIVDICCRLVEEATRQARSFSVNQQNAEANIQQLTPFFVFGVLLGKAPQVTSLIYNYFEDSSFQPLPEDSFQVTEQSEVLYTYPGFDDLLVRDILITYFKYLSHNPKWFSAVWNWSELGRFISKHPNRDIRYLATCCLSIITQPTRSQHMMLLRDLIREPDLLINQQMKHAFIYRNKSKPVIESRQDRIPQFLNTTGKSEDGLYHYCDDSIAKIVNVLMPIRDVGTNHSKTKIDKTLNRFVPVTSIRDTISKIAYSTSINRPCLIRGPSGSGKTSILDYIAAHTNRIIPPDYLKVQVGDQIDSKSLIGSYVCTDLPGQFEWQPGPLSQAMLYGSWIVFEDIDSAPAEMAQVIHSVIENKNLACVSCCPIKLDAPHPDFKIFFTQRTRGPTKQESLKLGFGFIERLCDVIDIPELGDSCLSEILEKRYQFGPLKDKILQIFRAAQKLMSEFDSVLATRSITLRDLFKFCDRVSQRNVKPADGGTYSSTDLDAILADAIDCFIASLPAQRMSVAAATFGQILNKPAVAVDNILQARPTIREDGTSVTVGRAKLEISKRPAEAITGPKSTLAPTRQSLQLMESVSLCVNNREPVLLVGETGVGKTTVVQHLASLMNTELTVINLSQQSDSADLLGGYKPVNMRECMRPIHDKFVSLFERTFDANHNDKFLKSAESLYQESKPASQWLIYLRIVRQLCGRALSRESIDKDLTDEWSHLFNRVRRLCKRLSDDSPSPMALAFSEGSLLRAVRKGKWILLDEINLAEPDVLQCLLLILDSLKDSRVYLNCGNDNSEDKSDSLGIFVHPRFRIFACMNPSTDIGKRDLPVGVRGRFTELFVNDLDNATDLRLIVDSYVGSCLKTPQVNGIVNFYQEARSLSPSLNDVSGNSPVYSLRTLCRALVICGQNVCMNMEKSLLESFKITFLQQLNMQSEAQIIRLMDKCFMNNTAKQVSELDIPMPRDSHQYVKVEKFWVQASSQKKYEDESYILTKSVRNNLEKLCRVLSLGQRRLPILIQGNTAVGKTSLIKYLARLTGNLCFRINNHEHTDLEEYVGKYTLTESGELKFQEGLLVTAMRKGYWVILDELNLAPSELLEALNRVLDDNRELFIPETRETIKAHSKFVLFATQNPPEEYAGRKLLSRAFRNRFVELHFEDLPQSDLEEILHKRCRMPLQYAKKVVTVMRELQQFRRESGCFGGKNSFMTMRDLFRWGQRYSVFKDTISDDQYLDWEEFMASEGLILLEGRVRTANEADIVKSIIEKVFKRKLDRDLIYKYDVSRHELYNNPLYKHIHFTPEFKRMYVQMSRAMRYDEPVLLCGQTGCGKTTACQLYAMLKGLKLITYNCHLNTESSDFVGNVRPARADEGPGFPWNDGPLIQAMRRGAIFLMDEISLADDAVLERINSVLEPERTITLTERDGSEISAVDTFRIVATMNPGGDYGKKELSPALRNRFTEIYCHNTKDIAQIVSIIEKSLQPALLKPNIAPRLIKVMKFFLAEYYQSQDIISLRDVLSWTKFLNKSADSPLSVQESIIHGACLVFFDQFGTCGHKALHASASEGSKAELMDKLVRLVDKIVGKLPIYQDKAISIMQNVSGFVQFSKFHLREGPNPIVPESEFVFDAPTVKSNAEKIARALQLDRPILLEGDPGAGKTSIVAALARLTGHKLVRINLSEQTDISDLFGSDLPDVDHGNDEDPHFRWHDGPMLRAIKDSSWILLDEMNLASQSVLEGLNACFDHRGEIYIPELDRRFIVDRNSTRIFACQNPYNQGAARKGLPQSFVNRFTSIYIASHTDQDLAVVLRKLYPNLPSDLVEKMIAFNKAVASSYESHEFNLRDLLYWCDLTTKYVEGNTFATLDLYEPERFVQFVYLDRLRSLSDKMTMSEIFEGIFDVPVYEPPYRDIKLGEYSIVLARAHLLRENRPPPHLSDLCVLKYQMPFIESIAKALELNRMPILVGEAGVGKRSMLKILAGLTGNVLNIVGANRDMDTVELLGSYEQKSLQREMIELVDVASKLTLSSINSMPRPSGHYSRSLQHIFKHIWSTLFASSLRDSRQSKNELVEAYRFQLVQLEELLEKIHPIDTNNDTKKEWSELKKMIIKLKMKVLYYSESTYTSGNFEWIDSLLVKSIKEGHWLMIENANLMNPATLDRLNSLVEPNGTLSLSEKGSGPDGIECVTPHKNFRLILTMNPEFGELSRAMRNRGAEIFIRTRFYYEDFLMLLNQVGFQIVQNTSCMNYCVMQTSYDSHVEITGEKPEDDGSLLAYFALNYSSILAHQIRRGIDVDNALADLLVAFYHQRGYDANSKAVRDLISARMAEYKSRYTVDTQDTRYKWLNFVHDLRAMTGGDAIPTTMAQERKLLQEFACPITTGLLKFNERIENYDVVHCCTAIKVFMEYSSPADFGYRMDCVKYNFTYNKMIELVDNEIGFLQQECLPMITQDLPIDCLIPPSDMYVDTRNSPDFHYTLMSQSYHDTLNREDLQNRWILSLYRINLSMITEIIQETSLEPMLEGVKPGTSLWALSEKVRLSEMLAQDLIRPQAEIVTDLFDLLNGMTRLVGNRCVASDLVPKMMARLFWISYFSCKLKRAHNNDELVAICNQIPMLWALTYQKVIVPLVEDCELADLAIEGKKISARIKHICEFLDVSLAKLGKSEKQFYTKVINRYASTTKRCETRFREIDKFFATLLGRYTLRSQSLVSDDNAATLVASNLIWSNSPYMSALYKVSDWLVEVENIRDDSPESAKTISEKLLISDTHLMAKRDEYDKHEQLLMNKENPGHAHREKCLNINRRRCALDQFSPIWQARFIHKRLSRIISPKMDMPMSRHHKAMLHRLIRDVNGIVVSPRYLSTLNKFLMTIERQDQMANMAQEGNLFARNLRGDLDMYAAFLVDHMLENIVLDNQIVGWMKLRVTTSDLSSSAPLVPEYSPIISLVSSYCLDITHLKLNAYQSSSPQLDAMLAYLWRAYAQIKLGSNGTSQDLSLARNLIHLRSKVEDPLALLAEHACNKTNNCGCIDAYNRLRVPDYDEMLDLIRESADREDRGPLLKAIRLVRFGFSHHVEYAPLFTLDPALRAREKMEVYTAELAHIKVDLQLRNTLHYWKCGENLRLVDISPEEAKLYPFSNRVLIERRAKLEKSLRRLNKEFTNRPKSDDGTLYYELRKEVQIAVNRTTSSLTALITDLTSYLRLKDPLKRLSKLSHLNTKSRMLIKSLEKSINRFKCDYILYGDITTQYLTGLCFVLQGLRLLHSRLEQKLQLGEIGFVHCLVDKFSYDMANLVSFNNFKQSALESANRKRSLYKALPLIVPEDRVHHTQSTLLRSILIQMNHHIIMTPSDIKLCIPIVRSVADEFHKAWLGRKNYLEEQRKKKEELYQYRTTITTLGQRISFEHKEFLDVVNRFPLYEQIYEEHIESLPQNDRANLETEAQLINLNKSVDLTMCVDVCKAHYKFMKEASLNLLGLQETAAAPELSRAASLSQLVGLESEVFYTMLRKCFSKFDTKFDSLSLECHLLQSNQLIKTLRKTQSEELQAGSLKSSIEILDENIFDIYHNSSPHEALKFQGQLARIDEKIFAIKSANKGFETHPSLTSISRLTARISSFLISDPLMKFVTGAHTLLQKLEDWNKNVPKESRMSTEYDELMELIRSWRALEIKSWHNSLHRVKRKYIDDTLCDLWFRLYDIFNDPMGAILREYDLEEIPSEIVYLYFAKLIKDFLEDATLGDYQIRLDLVFSFAIQTRFAGIYNSTRPAAVKEPGPACVELDYEKLTTYVYNIYKQYQGLMSSYKEKLEREETKLSAELKNEIRIVNWQGADLTRIKNNFRISHRKLNKFMNLYLEVLRGRPETVCPRGKLSEARQELVNNQASNLLASVFDRSNENLAQIRVDDANSARLLSLARAPKVILKSIDAAREVFASSKLRYVSVLEKLEAMHDENIGAIQAFHSHRVQDLTIQARDSKEVRAEKMKTCRQMYHSKKFSLQAIFKSMQEAGISHRRGWNSREFLDECMLSIEPLRGMIQNRGRSALRAASESVDDSLVQSCNEMYRDIMTKNQILLSQNRGDDITGEQYERVIGSAYDMVLDIIVHSKNAAAIYKHMIEIQAAASRLSKLGQLKEAETIVVYRFARVQSSLKRFNDMASRACLAVSKVELLMDCHETYSSVRTISDEEVSSPSENGVCQSKERRILQELIAELGDSYSLLTPDQFAYMNENLASVRNILNKVCSDLRDKLRHTIKSHLYSDDDIRDIQELFLEFIKALDLMLPDMSDKLVNARPGTILGSVRSLRLEAEQKLKPLLSIDHFCAHTEPIDLGDHSNLTKLDIRLQKLMKQVKLVAQEIYREESGFMAAEATSESARRRQKPFNHVNSVKMLEILRPVHVAKQVANCFMTLNLENRPTNVKQIVSKLAPLMSIYSQELSRYLNVIVISVNLKLTLAKQLIPFFIDLLNHGFGLPCKLEDLEGGTEEMSNGKESEDNVGFGEGKGANDASKKLEYESQLDELKKDDNEADKGESDENTAQEDEYIDAHDDGVEMSDDFDAKAEGPEDKSDDLKQQEQDAEDDEDELNEEARDLDKEFDQVDQDEEQLDQKFWDDEDEPLGEDDEEDLRQADQDQSVHPETEEKDFKAKQEELANASKGAKPSDPENQFAGSESEVEDDIETADDFDSQLDEQYSGEQDDQEQEGSGDNDESTPQEGEDSEAEVKTELAEENFEIDLTHDSEDEQNAEDMDMTGDLEDLNGDTPCQDEGDNDTAEGGELEVDMDLGPDGEKESPAQQDRAAELKGDATEQPDDEANQARLQSANTGEPDDAAKLDQDKQARSGSDPNQTESSELNGDGRDAGAQAEEGDQDGESTDDKSSKRTIADRSSLGDENQTIKRQRIEAAAGGEEQSDGKEEEKEGERVRHLEKDKAGAIEVVDLISEDEDEYLLDGGPEMIDQSSKPRNLNSSKLPDEGEEEDNEDEGKDRAERAANKDRDEFDENPLNKLQSTYNTNLGLLKYISHGLGKDGADTEGGDSAASEEERQQSGLMEQIDEVLKRSSAKHDEHESLETDRLMSLWQECTRSTGQLVHELCQQLQIVLQPTKMSKYKGDYKSGKRLNMRKIIGYIASQYRKDKIWLRRTKPCKRTYSISLAVDNSSSMCENNCRHMTYQSLALLAKSLSLIEAGSLNVVSFGERVKCIHEFDQPYVDAIGAQWLRDLKFDETRTSYAKLLRHSCDSFEQQARQALAHASNDNISVHQLLIIISDGRNVTSEEIEVKSNLKRLRSLGVLTLFLVIDDLKQNKGKSIVDVKSCVRFHGTTRIENYMDMFPFPFYVVLRKMEAMPSILGDALRQWFELVSSGL